MKTTFELGMTVRDREGREGKVVNVDVWGDGTTLEVEVPAGSAVGRDGERRLGKAVRVYVFADEASVPRSTTGRVRFDDSDYRFSHGKAPRGRGSWAFGFGAVPTEPSEVWFAPVGTFAEAKKAAKAEAERRGFSGVVHVLS